MSAAETLLVGLFVGGALFAAGWALLAPHRIVVFVNRWNSTIGLPIYPANRLTLVACRLIGVVFVAMSLFILIQFLPE